MTKKRVSAYYKPEGYWSRKEVAQFLGLSESMIIKLTQKGLIQSKKFEGAGISTFYDINEIKAFKLKREHNLKED